MKYKAKVYALYEEKIDMPNEASAKIEAVNNMMVEMQEFFHPKVKIMVKLEEIK